MINLIINKPSQTAYFQTFIRRMKIFVTIVIETNKRNLLQFNSLMLGLMPLLKKMQGWHFCIMIEYMIALQMG